MAFFIMDTGLLSPRIWGVRATFKAVLTAVDMKQTLQTKCKTCFDEGPRMILDTLGKILFQKSSLVFSLPSLTPPPGLVKDHTFSEIFFWTPSLMTSVTIFSIRFDTSGSMIPLLVPEILPLVVFVTRRRRRRNWVF